MATDYRSVLLPDIKGSKMTYYMTDKEKICPPRYYPPHMDDRIEVFLLIEGDVSFVVGNRLYRLRGGDAVLTRPREVHNCIRNSDAPFRHFCFWFSPESEFLFGDFLRAPAGKANLLSPADDETRADVLKTAYAIHDANGRRDRLSEYAGVVRLISLWHGCLESETPDSGVPELLSLILTDISDNLPYIHSLSYFTEKYKVSQAELRRLFAASLHTTPKSYLEDRRLAYSRNLLQQGMSVTDACMESGFSDLSNYIRLFRLTYGVTPLEYRKNGAANPEQSKYTQE